MKSFILTTIAILSIAGSVSAQFIQPDFRFEVGVNGGVSTTTVPGGPTAAYQGSKNTWNPVYSVNINYNILEKLQVGLEIGQSKWKTTGDWTSTNTFGQTLPAQKITYQYANPATSIGININGLIPFSSRYGDMNKANINYGIGGGVIVALNDGNIGYSTDPTSPDPTYKTVTQYNYGFGTGFEVGAQVGFTYFIVPKFGFNINLAARFVSVTTNEDRYGQENDHYRLFYFPHTIGLRYRF